jgi:uncharacterized membrane protein YgcG
MKVCVCVSSFFLLLLLQFGLEFMVDYCTMVTDSLIGGKGGGDGGGKGGGDGGGGLSGGYVEK